MGVKYAELLAVEEEKLKFNAAIGARIRKRRLEMNIPPKQMARALGYYHVNSMYKLERGVVQITPWHLHRLSLLLKTNPVALMTGLPLEVEPCGHVQTALGGGDGARSQPADPSQSRVELRPGLRRPVQERGEAAPQ